MGGDRSRPRTSHGYSGGRTKLSGACPRGEPLLGHIGSSALPQSPEAPMRDHHVMGQVLPSRHRPDVSIVQANLVEDE